MLRRKKEVHLEFHEESHTYIRKVDGKSLQYSSVTQVIKKYYQPFYQKKIASAIIKCPTYSTGRYSGMSEDEIINTWRKDASTGTRLHKCIEILLKDEALDDALKEEFSTELKYYEDFMNSYDILDEVESELRVCDSNRQIAGTIDFVTYNEDGTAKIVDWKRSGNITTENKYKKMKGCLSHLDDCKLNQYAIQVNLYRELLENNYLVGDNPIKVIHMCFVLLHPSNESYVVYDVDYIDVSKLK